MIIGLTGPIGCGKSTVARMLGERGALVIDADIVAREVTAPGQPAHDEILAAFGEAVRGDDGAVDRAALARVVFADPRALARLETIVHPRVRPVILERIETATVACVPLVAIEAIKLVEGGLAALCDEVWLVDCASADQRARMIGRGMAPDDVDRRIRAQGDIRAQLAAAVTRRLDTHGSLAEVEATVGELWRSLVG